LMNKENLLKQAKDEQFISGIHNYCDRWCERCPLTGRCMNFAIAEEEFSGPESRDMGNALFWQKLSETFHTTLELVKELAEREGIDLDAIDIEKHAARKAADDELARNHRCCRMAMTYGALVEEWFGAAEANSAKRGDATGAQMQSYMPGGDVFGIKASCEEALEVIRWYQHQIFVKLMRAVQGTLREEEEPFDTFTKDSDGSAKLALIGIERSMGAWGELRGFYFQKGPKMGDILLHLEGLRRNVEEVFPNARDFIRLGFDKVELNS
ncbi:MAG: hypothetical protein SWE60_26480, partial [Thermodesulfobacteriota bacterium]|nr:hypothetical protein [Thermodesulfobacteriota bacterium]